MLELCVRVLYHLLVEACQYAYDHAKHITFRTLEGIKAEEMLKQALQAAKEE